MLKEILLMILFLSLAGCNTVSQKAPDPFGADLHHKLDFMEPREVDVFYPAGPPQSRTHQFHFEGEMGYRMPIIKWGV